MLNRKKQDGMTAAGWMIIMSLVLFFAFLVVKLVPAYMEFGSIKSSMESVKEQNIQGSSIKEIRKLIAGRFTVNNVTSIKAEDVKLIDVTGGKAIFVEYEKKIPLFGNVNALLDFKNEVPLQ